MDTILRRMPDYVHYIISAVHRRPTSTSSASRRSTHRTPSLRADPDARRDPGRDPLPLAARHRLLLPLSMIHDSFMSRANSIVIPGGKLDLAMQLILTP